ncbi:MAG TPA: GNAT family N-acetyltransferase [Solirubrobacteraceae bacterium]|nr:GNAT family N-acetyltransferase [Solirubrobacteraceae bacterium]
MWISLSDGTVVRVREIRAEDKARLAAAHERLSPETVRRRYLTAKPRLSPRELRYLTEVDGTNHVALVAVLEDHPELIVAVARFVRDKDKPDTAEFAIVVGDPLQGKGLGGRLSELLVERARDLGITQFTATSLSDNRPAQALVGHISKQLTYLGAEGGTSSVVADLAA